MQKIFITGVSRGIGHGLAAYYLSQQAEVFGVSRSAPDDLNGESRFHFQSLDLRQHEQIRNVIAQFLADTDELDLAVLNAGVLGQFGDISQRSLKELKDVMEVNLWANKTLLDVLLNQFSIKQVVTISSGASVNGNRGWNGYSLSKAALNMLTRLYSHEYQQTHFCALAPGLVDTAMQDELCEIPADPRYPALEALRSRRGTPEMPGAEQAASKLAAAISRLPAEYDSGQFVDVRKM